MVGLKVVSKLIGTFDVDAFLTSTGLGRTIVRLKKGEVLFSQGDAADSVFYLQKGSLKLIVVSHTGKSVTGAILNAGDFAGEESMAGPPGLRLATAEAMAPCKVLKIGRRALLDVIRDQQTFSDMFMAFLLARSMKAQADLMDQLFNNSEKRLARTLLVMAQFGVAGAKEELTTIPKISQEILAELIGTTRARVCYFMNRFRKLGFIEYNGAIHVHRSLLSVVLHD
jgi:CRP-like cAMP-binding protein